MAEMNAHCKLAVVTALSEWSGDHYLLNERRALIGLYRTCQDHVVLIRACHASAHAEVRRRTPGHVTYVLHMAICW